MNIKFFKDLSKDSVDIAGGKGASLGEMTQAGIPVPPGFVVLSESFERFLKETDLNVEIDSILHSVNQNEMHTVENASEKIQSLIKSADMPEDIAKEVESAFKELGAEYVAVRSSATAEDSASAAWAGQLDSYLNTTEENLLKRVQDCWASLFTPRAIFYRIEKDLHNTKVSVAVVVQKMVDAEKSGIAFSVHPVTEDYNQLIVEAGFGLGEAIVSGQITPDSYVVEKDPRRIVDININTQNKALYKGKKGGNEWKDLSENEGGKQVLSKEEVMELSKLILKIEDHYGFPCDIEWAYEDGKFYIVQSRPITTLKENKNTKTDNEKKVISDSNLENYLNSKWHHNGSWKQNVLSASFWVSAQGTSYFKLILGDQNIHFINYDSNFWYLDKLNNSVIKKIKRIIKNDSFDDYFKNLIDISNSISNQYEKLFKNRKYDEKTLSELFSIQKELYGFWLAIDIIGENILQIALRAGWTKSEKDLLDKVQPHLFKTWIEKENNLLIDLANSNKSIDEKRKKYRDDYFWQGLYKWQGQTLSDSDIDEKIDNAKNGIKSKFKDYNINLLSDYDPLMKLSILSSYWRTQCSELATIFEFYVKDIVTDKVNKEINIINLTCDEIVDNNFSEPKDNFKSRSKGVFQYLNNNNEVITIPVMDENYSHIFKRFIKAKEDLNIITSQNIIKGTPVSKGSVQGTAKIILSKEDFNKFEQGNILVTTETTPVFVPLMKMSSAILTERGGVTSHAAIVSRELGVPCVISLKNITEHIQDGDKIEVDADKGIVKIIKKEQINQEKVFERFTSRPYSMIHIEAYNEALEQAKNELGHRVYPVFKYDSQKHLVEVFFEMNELHILFEHLGKKAEDQLFLDGVIKDFNESREKLEEIFQKAKVGEISLDQIDDVYRLFVRFFKGLMYVWVIPRLENIPQNVRDKVLEVRRETEHLSAQRDKLFPIILNSIYPKLEDNAYFVSCEHLERYESEDDLVNQAKKYADGFVYYQDDLVLQDDISDFLKKKEIDLSSSITSSADDKITGDIACQGKVQGIVRLIYTDKDLGKVSSSKDIIVSPMTRPDFLPAMKKASAFVTDEGGVTCHAAIVAREMKKPCIIGT
ncbi:MAG: PEP/pyruvate-binding domain-containing protein, partial [Candidatus Paceibacterota bacterium]